MSNDKIILIGYSGHAFVVADCIIKSGGRIAGYCDNAEKPENPFRLTYLGVEQDNISILRLNNPFIAIGDNKVRQSVDSFLKSKGINNLVNAVHPSATLGYKCKIGKGVLRAAYSIINPLAAIGDGVICNTGSIVEHECQIEDFAHIAPGAVLAGNVKVGKRSFIGANSMVKQGVTIGNDVIIGAGSVIIKDIPDNVTVVGNPGKIIKQNK